MKIIISSLVLALTLSLTISCTDSPVESYPVTDTTHADTASTADLNEVEQDVGIDTYVEPTETKSVQNECTTDDDCVSSVKCGEGHCIPGQSGSKCFVFAIMAPANFCDDEDPCTIDTCNTEPLTQKDHENGGCSYKPRACDDGNPCTIDLCDESKPDGCDSKTNPKACDDANACTKDFCLPGGNCAHVVTTCDDSDPSTEDGCTQDGGCYNNPVECAGDSQCSDKDPCTVDWCNNQQACLHEAMVCNDGLSCTNDSCFGGVCLSFSNCPSIDVCSENICSPITGECEKQAINVPDNKPCTDDICDPTIGWIYPKIKGCCVKDTDCVDGDACLIPVCDTTLNICSSVPKMVDDGIVCTVDSCTLDGYAQNMPMDSLCTEVGKPHCNAQMGGCVQCANSDDCNDGDPCTDDVCNWQMGTCKNNPKCLTPKVCNKESDYIFCDYPKGWCNVDAECHKPCFTGSCVANACQYEPLNCDDGDLCTEDTCGSNGYDGGCNHKWKDCNDFNPCTNMDACNQATGQCEYTKDAFCIQCTADVDCASGSACVGNALVEYTGVCHLGQCHHGYVMTCGGDACHDGVCQDGACIQEWKCDDGNACTDDTCLITDGCANEEVNCNDFNPCTKDSCDGQDGCSNEWDWQSCPSGPEENLCGNFWNCGPCKLGCDDGFAVTQDKCMGSDPVCYHVIPGLLMVTGVGIVNLGDETVYVWLKPDNDPLIENLVLEPGVPFISSNAVSFEIYLVTDKTGYKNLGFPANLPCLNGVSSLTKGSKTEKTLLCTSVDG